MSSLYPNSVDVSPNYVTTLSGNKIIIAAGCPESGWERVIPALESMGALTPYEAIISILEQFEQLPATEALSIEEPGELCSEGKQFIVMLTDSASLTLLERLSEHPGASFLLFYTHADVALANALSSGQQDPHLYLQNWQATNSRLIQFQRRHRSRALLLNADAAINNPAELFAACERIQLYLKLQTLTPRLPIELPLLDQLLAQLIVNMNPAIQSLQTELEARAIPLDKPPLNSLQDRVDNLIREYYSQKNNFFDLNDLVERLQKERNDLTTLAIERQNALAQARSEQKKLVEAHSAKTDELSKMLDDKTHLASDQESKLLQLEKKYDALKDENELLLLQVHQDQEELTKLAEDRQNALTQAESERKKLVEAHTAKINKLSKSLDDKTRISSEQDTKILQLQKGHGKLKEENELLQSQLHQVKQEFEHYSLKYQRYELDIGTACIKYKELEKKHQLLKKAMIHYWQELEADRRRRWFGKGTGTNTSDKALNEQISLVRKSGMFDEPWYLAEYPDVALERINPIQHYLLHGAKEGRTPSPAFNTQFYLESNPDVAASGANPLVHYILAGLKQGRQPSE
jgi:hypothetical protein